MMQEIFIFFLLLPLVVFATTSIFPKSRRVQLRIHDRAFDGLKLRSLVAKRVGLLNTLHVPQNFALWFENCRSIHTFGMHSPIDIVFLDKRLKVLSVHKNIPKNVKIRGERRTKHTLELGPGEAHQLGIEQGVTLIASPV